MSQCKLCLGEKELIKKSHIIPDFMYKDLFDNRHKIRAFSPLQRLKGEGFVKMPSSGEYEGGLLCADCDGKKIGSYEDYAKKAIYGGPLRKSISPICKNFIDPKGLKFTICENIEYRRFKLFILSILWRSSISKREFFKDIDLGKHEEIIRRMLIEGDPGRIDDYPISFMTFLNDKKMSNDIIAQPRRIENKDGISSFVFIISGMIYRIYINSEEKNIPKEVIENTLSEKNKMTILQIPEGTGMDFLMRFAGIDTRKKNH
ncbi:MAG: hypothetical protein A2281_11250 [Bacteroidetes bacterium RIFOXYA12_FULL_38_20]|nr:MAG: hypothetical protein UR43_C0018G0011 [candidate division TM6 bacterium GW2011_GWF2_33_332]OFY80863.1 MAG: hypothetical protein A2281_11250 [Bacteroidetes bacterium RIFOXYA12_FULL_38_20]